MRKFFGVLLLLPVLAPAAVNIIYEVPLQLTAETGPGATVGSAYSLNVAGQALGGAPPYTFSAGPETGPDAGSIAVSGAGAITIASPASAGTDTVTVVITDRAGWTATGVITIVVSSGGSLVLPAVNNVATNWGNAGLAVIGGIPNRTTQCGSTVSPSGLTPPQSGDDAALINAAITACTVGQVVQLATGTFQIDQSEYIALNKGVTLRGTGNCANVSSPYCSTVINVYNGAVADWTISGSTTGANCGVTFSSTSACTEAAGVILASPSGNYNWGWAGCFLGTNPTTQGCGTTLTADAAQGDTSVVVASTTNFSAGMWVLIDESPQVVSTTNPTGGAAVPASPEFLNNSASPAVMRLEGGDIAGAYSFIGSGTNGNQRLNEELHLITNVNSGTKTITFDDPLTLAFRQSGSHDARVYWPTIQGSTANPFLQQAGVENLSITKAANSGVQFTFCAYCWVKNIEVGTWIAGAVNTNYSARVQITGSYFHDGADLENNGNEYPIGINQASTEVLADNNIILRGGKGMVGRVANSAVVAYNYADETMYMSSSIGDYWLDMDVNGSHYAGAHHFLFEGNWGNNCDSDETHGNATYHTFFRNDCTAIRTTFVDPSNGKTVNDSANIAWGNGGVSTAPAPLRAAGPMAFDYWFAYLDNVLGTSGVTTAANGWSYKGAFGGSGCTNKCLWMSGWVGSEWPAPDPNLTTASSPHIFRNGNYDYVNASVVDNAGGYSQTFPSSLYLISMPAFFDPGTLCTYPWPWVTPTGSSQIQSNSCGGSGLPAQARSIAGTPFVQPGAPVMFQHIASSTNPTGNGIGGHAFVFHTESLPANTVAVMGLTVAHGITATVSDTLVGSWGAAVCTQDAGSGLAKTYLFVKSLGATGGVDTITLGVGGADTQPVQFDITFWQNINTTSPTAGSLCPSGGNLAANSSGLVSPGSLTPTNNNATGGNVIWNYTPICSTNAGSNPTSWTAASGFTLLNGEIIWTTNNGFPQASQYALQLVSASVTPSITATGENASGDCFNSVSVALAVANNGSTAPSGIHVAAIGHESFISFASPGTQKIQVPWRGNLRVLSFTWPSMAPGAGAGSASSATSSDGCNFTVIGGTGGNSGLMYAQNCLPCPTCTVSITYVGTQTLPQASFRYYDVQNALASSYQNETAGSGSCTATTNDAPTFTPTGLTTGLTLSNLGIGTGPITAFASGAPTGAVLDLWNFTDQTDADLADNADASNHLYYTSKATQNWNYLEAQGTQDCYWIAAAFN